MFFLKKSVPNFAVIVGARPNFIKAAPFFRRARNYPQFKFTGVHTGQHFDQQMSKVFFDELGIPRPEIILEMKGEKHTEKIGLMFDSLKDVFKQHKFDGVVIFGDVNSTLAGALASVKRRLPLVHIEAGLRSHDRRMPEEINRAIIDHLSNLLFVSEPSGVENLHREGVKDKKIHLVGNIMIESLEIFKDKIDASDILNRLNLKPKEYILTTIHRQENTDSLVQIKKILCLLVELSKNKKIVLPLHPGTKKQIISYGLGKLLVPFQVIDPLGYFDFIQLIKFSLGVLTDSGGIQEETSHLGIPCATLRDNTERPITLELGSNKLFSVEQAVPSEIMAHLNDTNFQPRRIPLWDDQVTERIFSVLQKWDF
jgi:UDP-N-acetylglucosamine 2-epimerase (non-hydrolysing)